MDEISRDPIPEPTNDDPTSPLARRFSSAPPLGPLAHPEPFDLEGGPDAPPPLPESRFTSSEFGAEEGRARHDLPEESMSFGSASDDDAEMPDLPGVADGGDATEPPPGGDEDEEPSEATTQAGEALSEVPELSDPKALARVVLAALLASREALSILRLAQVCNATQKAVEAALDQVRADLATNAVPLELVVVGGSARLLTTPDVFPYLQRLRAIKKAERLTPAAIETLAVIAYKQPVIRAEIEAIRGVKAGPMLRTLLDHKLVRVKGRRDVPGKPLEYETTAHFLERFGIQSLADLPSLREFKAIDGAS